jgi:hypothetical protein
MLGRRFLLLVAVLMGLTALAATLAPRDPAVRSERREAMPAPSASAPATDPATSRTVKREISADEVRPERVVVDEGDIVELEVASSDVDSVVLMNRIEPVDPNSNARFNVLADTPGKHYIELLAARRTVGVLEVRAVS